MNNVPDPGPPRTKTTVTFLLSNFGPGEGIACLSTTSVDEISVVICLTICGGVWEVSVGDQLVDAAIRLARFFLYSLQPEKRR